MSANDNLLDAALQVRTRLAPALMETAVQAFMGSFGDSHCPSPEELQTAMTMTRTKLREGLVNGETIAMLVGGETPDESRLAAIALSFNRRFPPLNTPALFERHETPSMRLALAALLGAFLGALIVTPVAIYLLGMRDVGLLLGPPLGAFITTWALDEASRRKWLDRCLVWGLGAAVVAEGWGWLSVNPAAVIWRRLSGRNSLARIAVYLILMALVVFTRRHRTYDRAMLQESVRQCIDQWLHGALLVLALLSQRNAEWSGGDRQEREALAELGKRIMDMRCGSAENLPGLANDVISAARDAGFAGLEAPVAFAQTAARRDTQLLEWTESMRERYNVFGHVEVGDLVRVEEEPVVFRGEVSKKGMVRKQRGC